MATLTTWGAANRVVTQDLASSFTREDVASTDSDVYVYGGRVAVAYYKYTRNRTKEYSYIGMDRATAYRCCAAMNALYCRPVWRWQFDDQTLEWKMRSASDLTNRDYECIVGGEAKIVHAEDDIWHVNIIVNESITIPWRKIVGTPATPEPAANLPYPWTGFEADPAIRTNAFRGRAATSAESNYGLLYDYDYDERTCGWGSNEDSAHSYFHSNNWPPNIH